MNRADLPGIINYANKPKYFRLMVDMNEDIDRDILCRALLKTMPRYPYFAFRIVRTKTGYDKIENSLPVPVLTEEKPLGSKEANYHWLEVILNGGKRMEFLVSHSITDGRGFMRFTKTLLYEYISAKYGDTQEPSDLVLPDSPLLPGEDEKVSGILPDGQPLGWMKVNDPFVIPEGDDNPSEYNVYEIRIPEKEFVALGKSSDASPLAMLTVIMAKVFCSLFPENEKSIYTSIAADYRKALGCPNSRFNNSYMFFIKHDPKIMDHSLETLGTMTRGMIILQSDDCNFRYVHNEMERINGLMAVTKDADKLRELRREIAALFLARATYCTSYVGDPGWGGIGSYISGVFTDVMAGKLMIELQAAGGDFCINWSQAFETGRYIDRFADILKEYGLSCRINGPYTRRWATCDLPQDES